jgi:small subunit ribosomal protein S20
VAHSLSAKKRVRQNAKRRAINRARKSRIKTQIKQLEKALVEGNAPEAKKHYQFLIKGLDQTAAAGTMHKKTAARKRSRLAKRLNKLAAQAK